MNSTWVKENDDRLKAYMDWLREPYIELFDDGGGII